MTRKLISLLALVAFCSCHKTTFEERVLMDIDNFNHNEAPKRTDQVTVIDSLRFDEGSYTILYFHTLEGVADDITVLTDDVRQQQRDGLLEHLKSNIQLKTYKERRMNFEYRYYSKTTGKLLMKFRFSAEDYI